MPSIRTMTYAAADATLTVRERRTAGGRETTTTYAVAEHEGVEGGRAWRLLKADGAAYDVFLDAVTGEARCDCIGGERYSRCKHGAAIKRLLELGRI